MEQQTMILYKGIITIMMKSTLRFACAPRQSFIIVEVLDLT